MSNDCKISSQDRTRNDILKLKKFRLPRKKWKGTGSVIEWLMNEMDSVIILLVLSN